jgi:hypothetical protein
MIKIYHHNELTKEERDELNGPNGGWDSNPRFTRYADVRMGLGPRFMGAVAEAYRNGEFTQVATVDTDDKEEAFCKTQHVEDCWTLNHGVFIFGSITGKRSTSCGDVFETEDGRLFVVASCGFKELQV